MTVNLMAFQSKVIKLIDTISGGVDYWVGYTGG